MRAALAFLTVLPVERSGAVPRRGALLAFPLAGLLVGGVSAVVAWGGTAAWAPLVGAALAVAVDLILTGALHVDAVADVADGIASRRPAEQAKAIMREPQVGAVGAAAAGIVLLLRLAWIATLAAHGLWLLIAAAPALGRAAMVMTMAFGESPASGSRAAEPDASPGADAGGSLAAGVGRDASPGADAGGSLAAGVGRDASPSTAAFDLVVAGALAIAFGALAAGRAGVTAAAAATAGVALFVPAALAAWRRRFGALTGDAVGAVGLTAELVALALLALAPQL